MNELSSSQQQQLRQRLLNRIRSNTNYLDEVQRKQPKRAIPASVTYTLSGIAAIFILVMGTFFYQKRSVSHEPASEDVVVINMTRSIQKQTLEDGSVVWLNPDSRIKYPKRFSARQRTVQMDGEAFFEVSHAPARPFVIYSGGVITTVVGTSFRIRSFKNVPTEVSVVTGKVSVSLPKHINSQVMLLPNQKVTYVRNINLLKKDAEKKASDMRIWQKTSLSFDNDPIVKVIGALNEKFGVNIKENDEKLLAYTLKADFTDQSLPSILEMLEKSLNVQYEIRDKDIILSIKR
jgi:ferric-dicitrate binding protein FerR (iron transport regulator)